MATQSRGLLTELGVCRGPGSLPIPHLEMLRVGRGWGLGDGTLTLLPWQMAGMHFHFLCQLHLPRSDSNPPVSQREPNWGNEVCVSARRSSQRDIPLHPKSAMGAQLSGFLDSIPPPGPRSNSLSFLFQLTSFSHGARNDSLHRLSELPMVKEGIPTRTEFRPKAAMQEAGMRRQMVQFQENLET